MGNQPQFVGKVGDIRVACWINKNKRGEQYLNLDVGGAFKVGLFKYKPEEKPQINEIPLDDEPLLC